MDQNDVSVPFSWLPAYGEAIENNLNSSRNILETILEETSDDDEDADTSERWANVNSGEWVSSNSESQSNSVIEVELNQGMYFFNCHLNLFGIKIIFSYIKFLDSETLSERDYICPAKRRKQDNEPFADTFLPRRPASDGDRYRLVDACNLFDPNEYLSKRNETR